MQTTVGGPTRNTVTVDTKGVVTAVLHGKQTAETIRELGHDLSKCITDLRAQGKRVLMITDLRNIKPSDSTPGSRVESKNLARLHADASVILTNRGLMSILLYVLRAGGKGNPSRIFNDEAKARQWLEGKQQAKAGRSSASLIGGVIICGIGLATLVGWQIDNQYLMSWLTFLRPMNPMSAIGLLALGFGFCCYWFNNMRMLKYAGLFGVALGVAALLPLHVDNILYGSKVLAFGPHAEIADSAALCFIAIGLSPFTIEIKQWWRRPVQYLIALALLGLSLFNIFGQMYARDFMYGLSQTFVMAFNLAIAFTISGIVVVLLVLYRKLGSGVLGRVNRLGWLLVVIVLAVQIATFGSWLQAVDRNHTSAQQAFEAKVTELQTQVEERESVYVNTLYGFKGLFAASDYVDEGEFEAYYDSLHLARNYPGLRALSFISKVTQGDLSAFVARHKADTSLHPHGNPGFTIANTSDNPSHYVVTYIADSASTGGAILDAQPSRVQAFERAEASGQPVSSGTVDFAATATAPAQEGFFLTIPVSAKHNPTVVIGFVNAVFNYNDFFAKTFPDEHSLRDINLRITDFMDGSLVYADRQRASADFVDQVRVLVADRSWNLHFSAPKNYGVSTNQAKLPAVILSTGQFLALLLLGMFVILLRSRREGYLLAEKITQDLLYERNVAVANDQKSSAILSSIGDAVFVIDPNEKIQLLNPAAQAISGYTEAEAFNRPYGDILRFEHEKTGTINRKFIRQALSGHLTAMSNHTVLVRKDGKTVPVADSAAPIRDAKGHIKGAIVVFRDVSRDYELDKAKTEFVSLASHQLRTPLSAINWYGEMLLNGDAGKLSKEQRSYVKEIFDGNQRMIELVGSLLDVSRIELGKLVSKPAPTLMSDLVAAIEQELTPAIHAKQLTLKKDVRVLPPLVADPKQLRMIVQNLMSNAVKYTGDKGVVHVTLRRPTAAELAAAKLKTGPTYVFFSVQDTGFGIPKAQQSKIFGKLFRADNVLILDTEGTGLGLYIVKQVVEGLGGRVWFESEENVGTTFSVVLPAQPKQSHKP